MSKNYSFEFSGTKEMFLNQLNKFSDNDNGCYYFDDYIIKISENEIRFGVARGGHSGGYWFIPTITEIDNKTTFCGKIQYIDSYSNRTGIKKIVNIMGEFLLFVILLPIIIIVRSCIFISWIVRKVFNLPKLKEESSEDRLYNLMEHYLNCLRK